jgi:hypothetical protein
VTAVCILLAIALLVITVIVAVGGSSLVDISNKYVEAESGRRTLLVEVASLKAQSEEDQDAVKRYSGLVTELNRKLAAARAEAVAGMNDASLTAELNGTKEM